MNNLPGIPNYSLANFYINKKFEEKQMIEKDHTFVDSDVDRHKEQRQ